MNFLAFSFATFLAKFADISVQPASFWYFYNGETPEELLK